MGAVIRAEEPPPSLPEYDQPPMPAPGYIWTPGYWAWNNYDYYWVPGTWVEPPRPDLLWTPGYWGFVDGVYAFHRGYWADHVGFYGGIVYGFGYTGHGYEGGRWENGHFFYNRTVNNFGSVQVTNVYEKNVVINNNNTRISFNGGKGGIEARPTPAEEAAARVQHVPPTPTQIEHARTASMNGALFESKNHGKPAIAATSRPAAFSGPGVVRAKEGGPTTPVNTPQKLKPGAEPPRPGAGPEQHPPGGTAPERSGRAPTTHVPEHSAAPGLPRQKGPEGQHVQEHGGAPVQNEPRTAAPAREETRHGPAVEHRPMAPHAEPPRGEAPRTERPPAARPEPHAAGPAREEMRRGPAAEHPPMAPHAEPPRGEAPHMEAPRAAGPKAPAARPAPRPEPHPAAGPAPRRGSAPHEPGRQREDH
ncbi:hypothetical protein [Nitrobacter sp.]|uniref:hypothetical protein n=1 Tax=Nitrobacter sp. TaxID=29420 RepID=UPI00399D75F2